MNRFRGIAFLAFVGAAISAVSAGEVRAQVVPYKASGDGVFSPATGDYGGTGVATHLGRHSFLGVVAVTPTANPLVFDFAGVVPQTTIAANGDLLLFNFRGQVELIPLDATFTVFTAVWTGDFEVVGGTGRFATAGPAARPLKVVAINDPFRLTDAEWTFSWTLEGKIRLR